MGTALAAVPRTLCHTASSSPPFSTPSFSLMRLCQHVFSDAPALMPNNELLPSPPLPLTPPAPLPLPLLLLLPPQSSPPPPMISFTSSCLQSLWILGMKALSNFNYDYAKFNFKKLTATSPGFILGYWGLAMSSAQLVGEGGGGSYLSGLGAQRTLPVPPPPSALERRGPPRLQGCPSSWQGDAAAAGGAAEWSRGDVLPGSRRCEPWCGCVWGGEGRCSSSWGCS